MKVTLLNSTPMAREMLIFTKKTRLEMSAIAFEEIMDMSDEEKDKELEYMANTIPSSWEFCSYTFMIEGVTRAFTHQFVRTRTGSYAQQSMRVTDMGDFTYHTGPTLSGSVDRLQYDSAMEVARDTYFDLVNSGVAIEDARGVLPTNIHTNIVAKFNLRTLSEMSKSRSGGRTQGEYRDVIGAMADEVLLVHPWADKFLFPKGREYFAQLEEAVAEVQDYHIKQNIRKAIDVMRKS